MFPMMSSLVDNASLAISRKAEKNRLFYRTIFCYINNEVSLRGLIEFSWEVHESAVSDFSQQSPDLQGAFPAPHQRNPLDNFPLP